MEDVDANVGVRKKQRRRRTIFQVVHDANDNETYIAANERISEEHHKLSYNERNMICEEIHGVACHAREESPDLLRSSLALLSLELEDLVQLDKLDKKNDNTSPFLSTGFQLSRHSATAGTYVNNPEFQLRFLRSENFDARKAAIRLMKFMNFVMEIFGVHALFRPIKLTDFKRQDLKVLQTGWLQVLPFRDRSGRKVFIWVDKMGFQYDPILRTKLTTYISLAGTRDIESQQKGIVCVALPAVYSPSSSSSRSTNDAIENKGNQLLCLKYTNMAIEALPIKICAIHIGIMYNYRRILSPLERVLLKMIMGVVPRMLPRMTIDIVGAEELRKILSGYGISINLIPVASSGAIKIVEFKKWLKFQRRIDDLETAEAYLPSEIDCPGSNDVVFRPGSSMIENPGNDMFRSLVESKVREVTSDSVSYFTQQKTKDDIAMEIVEEISQRKGRFLRWNNYEGCWAELKDISQVKSKIATTYRDLKLKTKRIRNDLSN